METPSTGGGAGVRESGLEAKDTFTAHLLQSERPTYGGRTNARSYALFTRLGLRLVEACAEAPQLRNFPVLEA